MLIYRLKTDNIKQKIKKYKYLFLDWFYVKFILPVIIKDKIEFIIDMLKLIISENSYAASIHLKREFDELNEYLKYYPESKDMIIYELEKYLNNPSTLLLSNN